MSPKTSFDVMIKNGRLIDGTSNPWFRADIGIRNGKIAFVGRAVSLEAETVIDAKELIVCPGFIDVHTHSEMTLFLNPNLESAIRQGVTTMVTGNCGVSLAPVNPKHKDLLMKYLSPFLPSSADLKIGWRTFAEYMKRLEKTKMSTNLAQFVGHGTVRIATMGFENRRPASAELEEMKELVAEALSAGAFGMSSGLIYPPGIYARTDELMELCKVAAKYDGIYMSHIRGEGDTLIQALNEAISIGEETNVPVEISHHKAAGKNHWGRTEETLRLMEEARARGVDVTCDQYPYDAGSTFLVTLLPPWVHEGGMDKLLERLRDTEHRIRIMKDIDSGLVGWQNVTADCGWKNIRISYLKSEKNKSLEGKNLVEIARTRNQDEYNALFDLLLEEEGRASMTVTLSDESDIRRVMASNLQIIGTDSAAVAPYGILGLGVPHPRSYGTYPRILGKYVREGVLTLENAVRKMTSFPAQRLGLRDRGLLREGYWADIVMFDPSKINDKATYQNPHQYPEGIELVTVNGSPVITNGENTGVLAGRVLRHAQSILDH